MAPDSALDNVQTTEPADTISPPLMDNPQPPRVEPVDEEEDPIDAEENSAGEVEDSANDEEDAADEEEDNDSVQTTKPAYIKWPPTEDNPWPPRAYTAQLNPEEEEVGEDKDRWFGISIGRCEIDPTVDTSRLISKITFSYEKFAYGRLSNLSRSKESVVKHIRQQSVPNSLFFHVSETVYRVYEDHLYVAIPKPLAKYIREKGRHGGIDHDVQLPPPSPDDSEFKKMKSWWDFKYFETLGNTHHAPKDFAFVRTHFGSCGLSNRATSGLIKEACISIILFRHKQPQSLDGRDKDKAYVEIDRVTGIYTSDEDNSLFLHYLLDVWDKKRN